MSLELLGDIELVQSLNNGRFYATARKCFISSTFDEATAVSLIGTKLKGSVVRQGTEAYDFTVPETGEVIQLGHRWVYAPEEGNQLIEATSSHLPSVSVREMA